MTGINTGIKKNIIDGTEVKVDDKYLALLIKNQKGVWKIDKLIWGLNH